MLRLNVAQAKARLSEVLEQLESGDEDLVVICRRNVAVAEVRRVPATRSTPRPIGGRTDFEVPDSFFEPLPDDVLELFEGRSEPIREPVTERDPKARR